MTYNFDPDRWYDMEQKALRARFEKGSLQEDEFQEMSEALQQRYEQMMERLDGTYRIPGSSGIEEPDPTTPKERPI